MKEKMINRWAVYIAGLVLLALGLVLNTKTGMGASPIVSIALCVSTLTGGSFANWTLAWYCVLVLAEMALHLLRRRGRLCLVMDLLQLPLSLVFTRFMGLFSAISFGFLAILLAAMTLWMQAGQLLGSTAQ